MAANAPVASPDRLNANPLRHTRDATVPYRDIDVSKLDLDTLNPRHSEVGDQDEALLAIIASQGSETSNQNLLANLALDIHARGLSPIQNFIVLDEGDGRFTVLDGNRRLAALRLLAHPNLLPAGSGPSDFAHRVSNPGQQPTTVRCFVVNDRPEATDWLERIHTGQLEGLGTVEWSPTAKHRFRPTGRSTQVGKAVAVIDWLRPLVGDDAKAHVDRVEQKYSTNLGRMVSTVSVQERIGFRFVAGEVVLDAAQDDVVRRMSALVAVLAAGLSVSRIKNVQQRGEYIDNLLGSDAHQPPRPPAPPAPPTPPAPPPPPPPKLFSDTDASGLHQRTRALFRELQALDLTRFRNAAAMLLRSAIELSVDEYLEATGQPPATSMKLHNRITAAVNDLQTDQNDPRFESIKADISKRHGLTTARNLHQYVHNHNNTPLIEDLAAISANYTPLINAISAALKQRAASAQ